MVKDVFDVGMRGDAMGTSSIRSRVSIVMERGSGKSSVVLIMERGKRRNIVALSGHADS